MRNAMIGSVLLVMMVTVVAWAWHEKEHFGVTAHAAKVLPEQVPTFFRAGVADAAAHCSLDPDLFKNRQVPHLNHAERPEHFFDRELVGDAELPQMRYAFYKLCHERDLDPTVVGTLPWAIIEWTQRLTIAFAEHRARPNDVRIQQKCLVYAGLLAHYAGDLCMPLHTTVHYDGRVANVQERSPRSGIHHKVDGLLRMLDVKGDALTEGLAAEAYEDVWAAIMREFNVSHALVDRVYELEAKLPDAHSEGPIADAAVRAFALERKRASIRFIASLYYTAWVKSQAITLPEWQDRDALTIE